MRQTNKKFKWVEINEPSDNGSIVLCVSHDKLFRILQVPDDDFDLDERCRELKTAWAEFHSVKDISQMEQDYRDHVEQNGVWGIVLEKWDTNPDCGYVHIDSIWGFDVESDDSYLRSIVKEMKNTAKDLRDGVKK